MKKLISLLLITILVLSFTLPVSAANPSGTVNDTIQWEIKNGTLYVTGTGEIPFYAGGKAPWLRYSAQVTAIEVGTGITAIGNSAFESMTMVSKVILPEGLLKVEQCAFSNCQSLKELNIPASVSNFAPDAIWGNIFLESLNVAPGSKYYYSQDGILYNAQKTILVRCPEGKKGAVEVPWGTSSIYQRAFEGCANLTEVSFPGTLGTIYSYAFMDCTRLERVYLPDSVGTVFEGAFQGCKKLTWVRLSPALSAIDSYTFRGCTSLTEVVIPEGITFIKDAVFQNCWSLQEITIPHGVKSLTGNVFNGCSALLTVNLPDTITSISNSTFYNCPNVKNINFAGTQAQWESATCAQTILPVSATVNFAQGGKNPVELPFTDVAETDSRYDAIAWAFEKKITDGTSPTTFSPDATCTRGQVVTFLWRMMNSPEPGSPTGIFRDVTSKDYFYLPVAWALEEKITDGMTPQTFEPGRTCSNAHILTFLWRAMGSPKAVTSGKEWYSQAMAWAESYGICGKNLDPNADCPRADVVQFMYNTLK